MPLCLAHNNNPTKARAFPSLAVSETMRSETRNIPGPAHADVHARPEYSGNRAIRVKDVGFSSDKHYLTENLTKAA